MTSFTIRSSAQSRQTRKPSSAIGFALTDQKDFTDSGYMTNGYLTRWVQALDGGQSLGKANTDYIKSPAITLCPSVAPEKFETVSYVYGSHCEPDSEASVTVVNSVSYATSCVKLTRLADPANFWLIADSWDWRFQRQCYMIMSNLGGTGAVNLCHSGKANVLFADNHVGTLEQSKLKRVGFNAGYLSMEGIPAILY